MGLVTAYRFIRYSLKSGVPSQDSDTGKQRYLGGDDYYCPFEISNSSSPLTEDQYNSVSNVSLSFAFIGDGFSEKPANEIGRLLIGTGAYTTTIFGYHWLNGGYSISSINNLNQAYPVYARTYDSSGYHYSNSQITNNMTSIYSSNSITHGELVKRFLTDSKKIDTLYLRIDNATTESWHVDRYTANFVIVVRYTYEQSTINPVNLNFQISKKTVTNGDNKFENYGSRKMVFSWNYVRTSRGSFIASDAKVSYKLFDIAKSLAEPIYQESVAASTTGLKTIELEPYKFSSGENIRAYKLKIEYADAEPYDPQNGDSGYAEFGMEAPIVNISPRVRLFDPDDADENPMEMQVGTSVLVKWSNPQLYRCTGLKVNYQILVSSKNPRSFVSEDDYNKAVFIDAVFQPSDCPTVSDDNNEDQNIGTYLKIKQTTEDYVIHPPADKNGTIIYRDYNCYVLTNDQLSQRISSGNGYLWIGVRAIVRDEDQINEDGTPIKTEWGLLLSEANSEVWPRINADDWGRFTFLSKSNVRYCPDGTHWVVCEIRYCPDGTRWVPVELRYCPDGTKWIAC